MADHFLFSAIQSFMAGFFCILISPNEPQAFTAQFFRNARAEIGVDGHEQSHTGNLYPEIREIRWLSTDCRICVSFENKTDSCSGRQCDVSVLPDGICGIAVKGVYVPVFIDFKRNSLLFRSTVIHY